MGTARRAALLANWVFVLLLGGVLSSEGEHRLFAKLFDKPKRLIRPVENVSDPVIVHFEVFLAQLIKVDEVNQIMETNLWLKHIWNDYKLRWDPAEYGGIKFIRVPSEKIWRPDIVLYNNADGNFQVNAMTKIMLAFDGTVTWIPPAIFKSSCRMDVTFFPFDYQNCSMKFGSWTHDKAKIDLAMVGSEINRKDFWESHEWDIIEAPGYKHDIKYNCCEEIYTDITYSIYIRRMPLFYTVNMIVPCLMISFLTVLVFYLPSDSGAKVTLCTSVLLSLTVFLLVITESIPSTSLVIPLIGEYLLFTMIFVILSIVITVFVLNVHYRTPSTHTMPDWVKTIFLKRLPRVMFMARPATGGEAQKSPTMTTPPRFIDNATELSNCNGFSSSSSGSETKRSNCQDLRCVWCRWRRAKSADGGVSLTQSSSAASLDTLLALSALSPEVREAIARITYIAENMELHEKFKQIQDDWKYVAIVIDRMFLWIFIVVCILGTTCLFLQPLMSADEI